MHKTGTLEVQLISADFLKDVDRVRVGRLGLGRQDPYAIVTLGSHSFRSKVITDGGKHPAWNETFTFESACVDERLRLEFFDKNVLLRDVPIGRSEDLALARALVEAPSPTSVLQLPLTGSRGEACGAARLQLSFTETRRRASSRASHESARCSANGEGGGAGVRPAAAPKVEASKPPAVRAEWILPAYAGATGTQPWADYSRGPLLRCGGGGGGGPSVQECVYAATHRPTGEPAEVRLVPKRGLERPEDVRSEVAVLHHLAGHPNVVQLKAVHEDRGLVYLVTEACPGGDLFDSLVSRGRYSEADAAALMRGVLGAVAHCHEMGVVHRDVTPDSFLLARDSSEESSGETTVKMTNFRLACFCQEGQALSEIVGTTFYVAPEVLRHCYGRQADVWSAGVMLYTLLCGRLPFSGRSEREILTAIMDEPIDLVSGPWQHVSEPAKDCVRRMLVRDPKRRATAQQILQHEWMRGGGADAAPDDARDGAPQRPGAAQVEVLARMQRFSALNRLAKYARKLIAASLPLEEVCGTRELFLEMDRDRSGTLSREELQEALRRRGAAGFSPADVARTLSELDVNGDGCVDYEEFLAATLSRASLEREDCLRRAFAKFDENGDGQITRQELFNALTDPALGADPKEIDEIIDQVDKDGDGTIDFSEFVSMMRGL